MEQSEEEEQSEPPAEEASEALVAGCGALNLESESYSEQQREDAVEFAIGKEVDDPEGDLVPVAERKGRDRRLIEEIKPGMAGHIGDQDAAKGKSSHDIEDVMAFIGLSWFHVRGVRDAQNTKKCGNG